MQTRTQIVGQQSCNQQRHEENAQQSKKVGQVHSGLLMIPKSGILQGAALRTPVQVPLPCNNRLHSAWRSRGRIREAGAVARLPPQETGKHTKKWGPMAESDRSSRAACPAPFQLEPKRQLHPPADARGR